MRRRLCLLCLPALLLVSPAAAAPQQVFALVVANNRSVDPGVKPLRYADDDGVRVFELLSTFATRAVLLGVLDQETQRVFPAMAKVARRPTHEELRAAMSELRSAMTAARRQGARTVFYFYFAGHGDMGAQSEGFLNLLDRRLSRSDLYREVIAASPAEANHIIIDACNSYYLINRRGPNVREALRSFLARESLDQYPNTGVVLSTASAAESHEWARYRSGIFSHQLLSALWGSADVNGDGLVDYRELAAYVAAANLQVSDARARLSIYARAPRGDRSAELIDLRALRRVRAGEARPVAGRVAGYLVLPRELKGRFHLEDDRGVRYADFHKSDEQPLRVALLDRPHYYLRSDEQEAAVPLSSPGDVPLGRLTFAALSLHGRGAMETSFRRDLYAVPFGRSFALGHAAGLAERSPAPRAAAEETVAAAETPRRPWYARLSTWKWIGLGTSAAALGAGIALQVLSGRSSQELAAGTGQLSMRRAVELQEEARTRQSLAGIAFGVFGAAIVSSVLLFIFDHDRPPAARPGRWAGAGVVGGGGGLTLGGVF